MSFILLGILNSQAAAALPIPEAVEFLTIAGGGGGGNKDGGGGGAGGYISSVVGEQSGELSSPVSTLVPVSGSLYTVTIGAGGASQTSGSNSIFATHTAIGGGNGGNYDANAYPGVGGSGGGGSRDVNAVGNPAAGTTNQGFAGGQGGSTIVGAGGGGAGQSGRNGSNSTGEGGAGISSSITNIATYRAGGGGGTRYDANIAGGIGGGGQGRKNSNGVAGTTNTGGGGGGSFLSGYVGGAGGSGIVIIRYPDTFADLSTIGVGLTYSLSVTGGYKIYSFTSGTGSVGW